MCLQPLSHWLAPKDWPNFFTYAKRYANAHNNGFGWDFTGAAHLDELQTKLRGSIMDNLDDESAAENYAIQAVPWVMYFDHGYGLHGTFWHRQFGSKHSHGCVNLSPEHAQWWYERSDPGDPITVTGSPVAGTWDDGYTEGFLTWKQLLRGSATHEAVEAGPTGSTFINPDTLPAASDSRLHGSKPHNYRAG